MKWKLQLTNKWNFHQIIYSDTEIVVFRDTNYLRDWLGKGLNVAYIPQLGTSVKKDSNYVAIKREFSNSVLQ